MPSKTIVQTIVVYKFCHIIQTVHLQTKPMKPFSISPRNSKWCMLPLVSVCFRVSLRSALRCESKLAYVTITCDHVLETSLYT